MTVKTVLLYDVSIHRKYFFLFGKHGNADVTVSLNFGTCRPLYQCSATSNINYRERRHRTEKRVSLLDVSEPNFYGEYDL